MNTMPYFDAHCDTLSRCLEQDACLWQNDGQLDLERLSAFPKAGQVFAIYHDSAVPVEGGLFAMCRRQQQLFADFCKKHTNVMAQCRSGAEIDAAVAEGNVFGCQFHPEKSGDVGLNILRAFVEMGERKKC